MPAVEHQQTRLSLLIRLTRSGTADETAWCEFVDIYTPLIYRWCRSHHLQDTDAKDVTQQVLLKLAMVLPTFTYDPSKSFRAWLTTLTHHAWVDFLSGRDQPGSGDSAVWSMLASVEAREDLLQKIEAEFDLEQFERAMVAVQARVEPATWEAFRQTALEGQPAVEVAKRLGKLVATVYVCRSNVQKMLQEEISRQSDVPLDS